MTEEGCARYVLWAAYVDLEYEGGGIGEYQYWNRTSEDWDDAACYYADGSGGSGNNGGDDDRAYSRCAKMDCHLEVRRRGNGGPALAGEGRCRL